jgi:hypothetical protein
MLRSTVTISWVPAPLLVAVVVVLVPGPAVVVVVVLVPVGAETVAAESFATCKGSLSGSLLLLSKKPVSEEGLADELIRKVECRPTEGW